MISFKKHVLEKLSVIWNVSWKCFMERGAAPPQWQEFQLQSCAHRNCQNCSDEMMKRWNDGRIDHTSVKFNVSPGTRYISRVRSNKSQPIQDIFAQINDRLNGVLEKNQDKIDDVSWQEENLPYLGNLFLGHVRYGTFGKNSIESVHPFLRQSNWKHQNLIVAGNFNIDSIINIRGHN